MISSRIASNFVRDDTKMSDVRWFVIECREQDKRGGLGMSKGRGGREERERDGGRKVGREGGSLRGKE